MRKKSKIPYVRIYGPALWRAQNRTCGRCGQSLLFRDAEVDHLTPQSKGGKDTMDNMRVICRGCNVDKGGDPCGVPHVTEYEEPLRDDVLEIHYTGVGPDLVGPDPVKGRTFWNPQSHWNHLLSASPLKSTPKYRGEAQEHGDIGGWAFCLVRGDKSAVVGGDAGITSDNRMAVYALWQGLKAALEVRKRRGDAIREVRVLGNNPCHNWIIEEGILSWWQQKGWVHKSGKPVRNADLWRRVAAARRGLRAGEKMGPESVPAPGWIRKETALRVLESAEGFRQRRIDWRDKKREQAALCERDGIGYRVEEQGAVDRVGQAIVSARISRLKVAA